MCQIIINNSVKQNTAQLFENLYSEVFQKELILHLFNVLSVITQIV